MPQFLVSFISALHDTSTVYPNNDIVICECRGMTVRGPWERRFQFSSVDFRARGCKWKLRCKLSPVPITCYIQSEQSRACQYRDWSLICVHCVLLASGEVSSLFAKSDETDCSIVSKFPSLLWTARFPLFAEAPLLVLSLAVKTNHRNVYL